MGLFKSEEEKRALEISSNINNSPKKIREYTDELIELFERGDRDAKYVVIEALSWAAHKYPSDVKKAVPTIIDNLDELEYDGLELVEYIFEGVGEQYPHYITKSKPKLEELIVYSDRDIQEAAREILHTVESFDSISEESQETDSSGYPSDWDSIRKEVYKRDNYTCQNCDAKGGPRGNSELHAHHIVPKAKGGSHRKENLVTLCSKCHHKIPTPSGSSNSTETGNPSQDRSSEREERSSLRDLLSFSSGQKTNQGESEEKSSSSKRGGSGWYLFD